MIHKTVPLSTESSFVYKLPDKGLVCVPEKSARNALGTRACASGPFVRTVFSDGTTALLPYSRSGGRKVMQ